MRCDNCKKGTLRKAYVDEERGEPIRLSIRVAPEISKLYSLYICDKCGAIRAGQ